MRDVILSFIDCETGGFDEGKHALLEVAVVRCRPDGTVLSAAEFPVRLVPGRVISGEAFALHGLDGSVGPDPAETWSAVRGMLDGTIAAGYNLEFDLRFLRQFALDIGGAPPAWHDHHNLDVAALAMPWWLRGHLESCSLRKVAKQLGVKLFEPAHRALSDCLTTIEVFKALTMPVLPNAMGNRPRPVDA